MQTFLHTLQWITDNWQLIAQCLALLATLLTAIATAIVANTKLRADAPVLLRTADALAWVSHQDAVGLIGRFNLPGLRSKPVAPPTDTTAK